MLRPVLIGKNAEQNPSFGSGQDRPEPLAGQALPARVGARQMVWLLLGLVVGALLGVTIMALLAAAGSGDGSESRYSRRS